jgi:hypothetical protein
VGEYGTQLENGDMNRWLRLFWLALTLSLLQACASINPSQRLERVPIPGGVYYSWGTVQKAEDFANVEIAQSRLLRYSTDLGPWRSIHAAKISSANVIGLQTYYPLQARWRLRDGREFILESVDQGALVRDYMKTHDVKPQWEREGRKFAAGDSSAILAHDIKDDTLRLKWVVRLNRTPVNERLQPGGAANPWTFEDEEHVVAVIKGMPTSGIDFTKINEPRK